MVPASGRCTACRSSPARATRACVADGTLAEAWTPTATPAAMVGAGPFVLERHEPGVAVHLARNPHYWRDGRRRDTAAARRSPAPRHRAVTGRRDAAPARRRGRRDHRRTARRRPARKRARSPHEGRLQLFELGPSLEADMLWFNLRPPARPAASGSSAGPAGLAAPARAARGHLARGRSHQLHQRGVPRRRRPGLGHDHARQSCLARGRHRAAPVLARDGRRAARSHRRPRSQRRWRARGRVQRARDVHAARAAGAHGAPARGGGPAGSARQGRLEGRDRQPRRARPAGTDGEGHLRRDLPRAAGLGHRPVRPDGVLALVGTLPPLESRPRRRPAPNGSRNSTC